MHRMLSPFVLPALFTALAAGAFAVPETATAGRLVLRHPGGGITASHAHAVRGPYGGWAARAGATAFHPDGSASRVGGFSAAGLRGSVASSGGAVRDAAGHVTQSRTTTATSALTGNTMQRSTSYSSATGLTRSTTCHSAAGAVIPCR